MLRASTMPARPAASAEEQAAAAEEAALLREYGKLERDLRASYTVYLAGADRQLLPTDYPDLLDLTNRAHAVALVGPGVRFTKAEIFRVYDESLALKNAVDTCKQLGDAVIAWRDARKRDPAARAALDVLRAAVGAMRVPVDDVKTRGAAFQAALYDLRAAKTPPAVPSLATAPASEPAATTTPPVIMAPAATGPGHAATGSGGDPKVFPASGAAWICVPIAWYKEAVPDPAQHTVAAFVRWVLDNLDDPFVGPALTTFVGDAGGWRDGSYPHAPTVRANVAAYLKSFKGSLPPAARLRDEPVVRSRSRASRTVAAPVLRSSDDLAG